MRLAVLLILLTAVIMPISAYADSEFGVKQLPGKNTLMEHFRFMLNLMD